MQVGYVEVQWRELNQVSVERITAEVEFVSPSKGTKKIFCICKIMTELDGNQDAPTQNSEDIQGPVVWSRKVVRYSKHVSIRRSFVK